MEKAGHLVARLTVDDRVKLRQCVDKCLSAAIKFDETGKPEYFVKIKVSIENLWKH